MKPPVVPQADSRTGRVSRAAGARQAGCTDGGSAAPDGSGAFAVRTEWGRLTRFLESARLAFARERNLWTSLEIESAEEVKLSAPTGQGA